MNKRLTLYQAWAALHWERAAPLLAPVLVGGLIYGSLALFGLFEWLGDPWRAMIAISTVAVTVATTVHALQFYKAPTRNDALRRIEDDTGLTSREFETLSDTPATGHDGLWALYQERVRETLKNARAYRPRAAWARLDPYGLRIGLAITFCAGLFLAGNLAGPRLWEAMLLRYLDGGGRQLTAEIWIEPPLYTGRPTLYLRERRQANVPENSVLAARVTGVSRPPRISGGEAEIEEIGDRVWQIRVPVTRSGLIHLRGSGVSESVSLSVIYDELPRLTLSGEPEADADGTLSLTFTAEDDYGVESYQWMIRPADDEDADWQRIDLPASAILSMSEADTYRARETVARHPLSGKRVILRVAGTDGAGQTGRSDPLELVLPGRVFLDSLAQAIVEERRGFIATEESYAPLTDEPYQPVVINRVQYLDDEPERRFERAPAEVQRLAYALDAISDAPHYFFEDWVVYTGLKTATNEVRRAREMEDLAHLDEDLWQMALRAELGSLADAEAALRAAERALSEALARGADALELGPLFDAFERAMENYIAALARESMENMAEQSGGGQGGSMSGDQLEALLEALREAAELGDSEDARRAMAALMELLRNLQFSAGSGDGEGQQDNALTRALREALEELSDAIGEQRDIMGDTFEESDREPGQGGLNNPAGPPSASDIFGNRGEESEDGSGSGPDPQTLNELAERQRALEQRLQDLTGQMPGNEDTSEALGQAGDAMGESEDALGTGDPDGALEAQDDALQSLQDAAGALAQQLLEAVEAQRGEQGQGTDPLGRALGGVGGSDTELPSQSERQRARDILEELRRRASEMGRPQEELDYIDRLLERF